MIAAVLVDSVIHVVLDDDDLNKSLLLVEGLFSSEGTQER